MRRGRPRFRPTRTMHSRSCLSHASHRPPFAGILHLSFRSWHASQASQSLGCCASGGRSVTACPCAVATAVSGATAIMAGRGGGGGRCSATHAGPHGRASLMGSKPEPLALHTQPETLVASETVLRWELARVGATDAGQKPSDTSSSIAKRRRGTGRRLACARLSGARCRGRTRQKAPPGRSHVRRRHKKLRRGRYVVGKGAGERASAGPPADLSLLVGVLGCTLW